MAEMVEQKSCNVLIVGKSGAGKTSLANALFDGDIKFSEVDPKTFTSTTKKCSCKTVTYPIEDGVQVTVKVIDTIGLFDTEKTSNSSSIRVMKEFVRKTIPEGISLVIFVMKKGRFTEEEQKTFEFIIKKFKEDISAISALCITNTEQDKEPIRDGIIHEFEKDTKTQKIAKFMQKGIYAVGFPSKENLLDGLWEVLQETITKDKEKTRALVKRSCELHLADEFFKGAFWDKCKVL